MCFGNVWTVWVPKKMHPKRFFQCIFHIKTKLNSLQILQKKISFRKTQITITKASGIEIFGLVHIISPSSIWLWYALSILALRKHYICPRNVWMGHSSHSLLFEQNAKYLVFKLFVLVDTEHCDSLKKDKLYRFYWSK